MNIPQTLLYPDDRLLAHCYSFIIAVMVAFTIDFTAPCSLFVGLFFVMTNRVPNHFVRGIICIWTQTHNFCQIGYCEFIASHKGGLYRHIKQLPWTQCVAECDMCAVAAAVPLEKWVHKSHLNDIVLFAVQQSHTMYFEVNGTVGVFTYYAI